MAPGQHTYTYIGRHCYIATGEHNTASTCAQHHHTYVYLYVRLHIHTCLFAFTMCIHFNVVFFMYVWVFVGLVSSASFHTGPAEVVAFSFFHMYVTLTLHD